jgi:hypothetical protein
MLLLQINKIVDVAVLTDVILTFRIALLNISLPGVKLQRGEAEH